MLGTLYSVTIHLHGTLSADAVGAFKLPGAATLLEISANAENDSDATIDVGDAGDPDGVIDGATIGDSGTPTVLDADDFNGDLANASDPYHYPVGDREVHWSLDHDGDNGTAAQNVTIVFWFLEG